MNEPEKSGDQNNEVTLVLRGNRVTAQKAKLADNSLYFAALFSENFRDHQQTEFEINFDISLTALQNFVSWANNEGKDANVVYSSEYHFNVGVSLEQFLTGNHSALLELLHLSIIFAADKLTATITEMIICMRLHPDIMLEVWLLSEDLSLSEVLGNIAFASCLDRFEELSVASLLKLSKKNFYRLFFNTNINCSLAHKLEVIKAWRNNRTGARGDANGFTNEIELPDCSQSVLEEKEYDSINYPADPIEIVANSTYLETFHETTRPQLMSCAAGRKSNDNVFIWAWNGKKREIEEIAEMTNSQMHTTFLDNGKEIVGRQVIGRNFSIYLIGGEQGMGSGRFNTTIWRYCLFSKKWYIETKMPQPRRHMAVVFLKNKLYLIGGVGRHRLKLFSVDVYDIHTGLWSRAADIPESFTEVPAAWAMDGCIFYNKYLTYYNDPLIGEWKPVNNGPTKIFIQSMLGCVCRTGKTSMCFFSETKQSGSSQKLILLSDPHVFYREKPWRIVVILHEWYFPDDSHMIYQQIWNDPWFVSFGSKDDVPYVEISEYSEQPRGAQYIQSYTFSKDLTNVPADCFKYRLGCFNIIDPRTLHNVNVPIAEHVSVAGQHTSARETEV